MVKRKSKGSLLGRSSSSSKDKTGLYLVSIVAIVAVVALFLMVKGGSSEVSEEVMVVDEEGNLIGEASNVWEGGGGFNVHSAKNIKKNDLMFVSKSAFNELVSASAEGNDCPEVCSLQPCGGKCPDYGCCDKEDDGDDDDGDDDDDDEETEGDFKVSGFK